MVTRWAVVRGGVVENVILWDGDLTKWKAPAGATLIELTGIVCAPGYTFNGSVFSPPPDTTAADVRTRAKSCADSADPLAVVTRAFMLVTLSQINAVRAKLVPPLSALTIDQLKTALRNEIDAGRADS